MKEELFQELLQSVREGGAILRGEAAPRRAFSIEDPDVAEVRELYGLSQAKFAGLLGISVKTLQNWEQRRRRPEGPARVLLRVAAKHPEAVLDVVTEEPRRKQARTGKKAAKVAAKTARRRVTSAARRSKSTK